MAKYKVWKTGELVEIEDNEFQFPPSGEKILFKLRPPIAKTVNTD